MTRRWLLPAPRWCPSLLVELTRFGGSSADCVILWIATMRIRRAPNRRVGEDTVGASLACRGRTKAGTAESNVAEWPPSARQSRKVRKSHETGATPLTPVARQSGWHGAGASGGCAHAGARACAHPPSCRMPTAHAVAQHVVRGVGVNAASSLSHFPLFPQINADRTRQDSSCGCRPGTRKEWTQQ